MLIAGPTLAIDRTVGVDRFNPGQIHKVNGVETRVGGAGANATRVARSLGVSARLLTLIPEVDLATAPQWLVGEGMDVEWVTCEGSLPVATILRERAGRLSVLSEPGPAVDAAEWEAFTRLVQRRLRPAQGLLCSGSLPPGAPTDGYAQLAGRARHAGSPCVVDVAGPALAAVVDSGEGVVTPNLAEAESLVFGRYVQAASADDDPRERAQQAASQLLHQGAFRVVVTAGSAGAAYAEQGPRAPRGWIDAAPVVARNPIGAGDAFACALTLRLQGGATFDSAVAYSVGVAASHVEGRLAAPSER